jgi:hypothetical protein
VQQQPVKHHVTIMGEGPSIGSQEPSEVLQTRVQLLPTNLYTGPLPGRRHAPSGDDRETAEGLNPAIAVDPHNSGEAVGLGGRGGWSTARGQKSTRGRIVGRRGRGRGRNNVDRVSMITMPGNLEVSDGGEAVEIGALQATPTSGLIASHGWVPPAIVLDTRSPFLLRPRTSSGRVYNSNFEV